MIRVAISIAHATHVEERKATLRVMLDALAPDMPRTTVHIETHRGPPHEWSERQWLAALRTNPTHCLLLNDDLILCEDFMQVLGKVIAQLPSHVINLYNAHPLAEEANKRGMRWLTSVDGLIGNAYVLPADGLRAFLEWRNEALLPGVKELLSEDQLVNLWAMATGALIWHTVPALVDHDVSIPSCYGNENNVGRVPTVRPRGGMIDVNWATDALHVGRVFKGNHHALVSRLKKPLPLRFFAVAG